MLKTKKTGAPLPTFYNVHELLGSSSMAFHLRRKQRGNSTPLCSFGLQTRKEANVLHRCLHNWSVKSTWQQFFKIRIHQNQQNQEFSPVNFHTLSLALDWDEKTLARAVCMRPATVFMFSLSNGMTAAGSHALGPVWRGLIHQTLPRQRVIFCKDTGVSVCVHQESCFCTALPQTPEQAPCCNARVPSRCRENNAGAVGRWQPPTRTPQWTRAFPRGCSRRTASRSTGGGTPRTRPRASPRCWAGARARWGRPGRSGSASGWPRTWTGRSRGVLWSASPLPSRLLFAKRERNTVQNPGYTKLSVHRPLQGQFKKYPLS